MGLTITSSKLTGTPGSSGWAQVHDFFPEEPEKQQTRGHLFAVVSTGRLEEGIDAVSGGRELLARLHEEYFGDMEGPAFAVLQNAVKKVSSEFGESWGEVEIAAVAQVGDVAYSVAGGGASVAIFRSGMMAKILESTKEEVISASGYPKENDLLIVATKAFFEVIATGVMKAALEGADPALAAEELAPYLHSAKDSGNMGATIIAFKKIQEAETITPEVTTQEKKEGVFAPYLQKGKDAFAKLFSKVLPDKKIYVKTEAVSEEGVPQKKKTMVSVGIILALILLVSIGFGIKAKNQKEVKGRYQERLTQAQHEYQEALSLTSLNPDRARELFVSSKGLAEGLKNEGVKDESLEALLNDISQNQGSILGEYQASPELFVDLSLQTSGFTGEELASSGETIFILDKASKRIISTSFATKKTEAVAGPDQISDAQNLGAYEDRSFVLNPEGINEVGEKSGQVIEKDWQGEALIYAYAGNIYVVDKGASQILRYPGSGSSFASAQSWLAPGIKADLSQTEGLTVDGTLWLLSSTGKISRFSQGSPLSFSPDGVFPALTSPEAIYTNESLNYVYVLDSQNARVVVLDKEGNYKAQYKADIIKQASDLAVSEKDGKIVILVGGRLYSIELKHL